MKLSLTVEADAVNILAFNMGRTAVDIDGIELTNLIDVVCDNGCILRVQKSPGNQGLKTRPYPSLTLTVSSAAPHISPKPTTTCCSRFRINMKTMVTANGLCIPAPAICCVWRHGLFRYCS